MIKVAKNFLWIMLSFMLMLIHIYLIFSSLRVYNPWAYLIGIVLTGLIAWIAFSNSEKLIKQLGFNLFMQFINRIIKTWWFSVALFFIFVFLFNFFINMGQLFMSQEEVYSKITVDGSKYYGVILVFIFSGLLLVASIVAVNIKISRRFKIEY